MHKKLCMVLVGAPCSGKSTIGKATAEEFGESAVFSTHTFYEQVCLRRYQLISPSRPYGSY